MASMVIRNLPDDVMERFRSRAKADGKSTEQLAREVISVKAGMTREEAWAEMDRIRARSKPVDLQTTLRIREEVRRERDGDDDDFLGFSATTGG